MIDRRSRRLEALARLARLQLDEQRVQQSDCARQAQEQHTRRDEAQARVDAVAEQLRTLSRPSQALDMAQLDWQSRCMDMRQAVVREQETALADAQQQLDEAGQRVLLARRREDVIAQAGERRRQALLSARLRREEIEIEGHWMLHGMER